MIAQGDPSNISESEDPLLQFEPLMTGSSEFHVDNPYDAQVFETMRTIVNQIKTEPSV